MNLPDLSGLINVEPRTKDGTKPVDHLPATREHTLAAAVRRLTDAITLLEVARAEDALDYATRARYMASVEYRRESERELLGKEGE